jgi:hypothetical protein
MAPTADPAGILGDQVLIRADELIASDPWNSGSGDTSGAVYVFLRIGHVWYHSQTLRPSDAQAGAGFGRAIGIDEDLLVVTAPWDSGAAPGAGAAYVFRRVGNEWIEEQKLVSSDLATNDRFGSSCSVNGLGLVIGAILDDDGGDASGSAYVFRYGGNSWVQEQKLIASDAGETDQFGWSAAMEGDVILVGAFTATVVGWGSGAVYVFRYDGSEWVEEQKLIASDITAAGGAFGYSVARQGDIAVVGRPAADEACPWDPFCNSGSAYVFRFNGSDWVMEQKLLASDMTGDEEFGISVAINDDVILAGAYLSGPLDTGAAYVFRHEKGQWLQQAKLTAADGTVSDKFGGAVAIQNGLAAIGAYNDSVGPDNRGSVYLFGVSGDCNANSQIDLCEIKTAPALDQNGNYILDQCEPVYGDIYPPGGDDMVDVDDLVRMVAGYADPQQFPEADIFPCGGNVDVDVDDLTAVVHAFGGIYFCVWNNGQWQPAGP